jgi:hypothetical protein
MNKQLRKLHVTAQDVGHCLVCGGVDGNCTCVADMGAVLRSSSVRNFTDLRTDSVKNINGACSHLLCESCGGVVSFGNDVRLVRCKCGRICKHDVELPVIPEPDYSVLEGISSLPSAARRKPKLIRSRK